VHGIRVNVVAPGNIDTAMKRTVIDADVAKHGDKSEQAKFVLGDVDGMAKILAFLVSDDADYVRGEIFTR
jgi:NAD(P)-dependent dehydrogenase (short-subunit alcohol dehydrogenase family)